MLCWREDKQSWQGSPHHFPFAGEEGGVWIEMRIPPYIKMNTKIKSLCCICGGVLPPRAAKVCSSKCCAILRWGEKKERQCLICGEHFMPRKNSSKIVTCSKSCGFKLTQKTRNEFGIGWPKEAWIASAKTPRTEKWRKDASLRARGFVHKSPNMARHSAKHHSSSVFFVKSPRNITYLVMNATAFVAANESLFEPETVIWKTNKHSSASLWCLASRGLQRLNRGEMGSWHGWMLVGNTEGKESVDYVPRDFILTPH